MKLWISGNVEWTWVALSMFHECFKGTCGALTVCRRCPFKSCGSVCLLKGTDMSVSYTHLTLPTNREV